MQEIKVTVEPGVKELVIRTGDAPDIREPNTIEIEGNIYAPGEFLLKRKEEVLQLKQKTQVHVWRDHISLVVDEESPYAKHITGRLFVDTDFDALKINCEAAYTIENLYKMLRMKGRYFANREAHAAILSQLKSFEAKTEVEFKSTNDYNGTVAFQKIATCKTNLNYEFGLFMPIYKGVEAQKFNVSIEFEPNKGSIICWLVSEDLLTLQSELRDKIMKEEVKKFSDFVVIEH